MSTLQEIATTLSALRHAVPAPKAGDLIGAGSLHHQALASMVPSLRAVEGQFSKAAPSAMPNASGKTSVVTSINIATSLMDGMESGEVELSDVQEGVTMLTASLDEAIATVNRFALKKEQASMRAHDPDGTQVNERLFGKTSKYASTLPKDAKAKDDPFIIRHLPIVPQFEGVVTTEQLAKAGFRIEGQSGFYTVLGNQLVIGINLKHEDLPANLTHYAKQIAAIVGQKSNERYSIMGDELVLGAGRRVASSKGYVYFWAVPHALLNRMNRLIGEAVLNDWGFPFR